LGMKERAICATPSRLSGKVPGFLASRAALPTAGMYAEIASGEGLASNGRYRT
jgi:hypothetical protein